MIAKFLLRSISSKGALKLSPIEDVSPKCSFSSLFCSSRDDIIVVCLLLVDRMGGTKEVILTMQTSKRRKRKIIFFTSFISNKSVLSSQISVYFQSSKKNHADNTQNNLYFLNKNVKFLFQVPLPFSPPFSN